jgi:hypothetical protein
VIIAPITLPRATQFASPSIGVIFPKTGVAVAPVPPPPKITILGGCAGC